MASHGKKKFYLGPIIDSDDSDHEYMRRKTIEECKYEIDVARFYKTLNENLFSRNSDKKSVKTIKVSKAVQTDPDTSSTPPSWLHCCQKLVTELNIGLDNMINTIYHTPNGYCKGDAGKGMVDPPNLKFFKYESGYWQSKLLPQVKIPATVGLNKQLQSENFKSELYGLLEKATKLQNVFPYAMAEGEDRVINDDETSSRNQSEATGKDTFVKGTSCRMDASSCTDLSEKFGSDFAVSGPSMRSGADARKPATYNTPKKSNHVLENRNNVKSRGLIPAGVAVSKLNSPHQAYDGFEISVPKQLFRQKGDTATKSVRDNRNGIIIGGRVTGPSTAVRKETASRIPIPGANDYPVIKDTNRKVENAFNSKKEKKNSEKNHNGAGKTGCSSNDGKNFIKINILASKIPVYRGATTSKSTTQSAVFPRNGAAQRETK